MKVGRSVGRYVCAYVVCIHIYIYIYTYPVYIHTRKYASMYVFIYKHLTSMQKFLYSLCLYGI